MDLMRLFMRIALIARRRQSTTKLIIIAVVVVVCAALAGVEWLGLKPDWMTASRPGRIH